MLLLCAFQLLLVCSLSCVVFGQCTSKDFQNSKIVPDVLPEFSPTRNMEVAYKGKAVTCGSSMSILQTIHWPTLKFDADDNEFYTIVMLDPDALLRQLFGTFLQWQISNIPGNATDKGDEFRRYVVPSPPPLTGSHRYITLLYSQKGKKIQAPPRDYLLNRYGLKMDEFAQSNDLTGPIAGHFFYEKTF